MLPLRWMALPNQADRPRWCLKLAGQSRFKDQRRKFLVQSAQVAKQLHE